MGQELTVTLLRKPKVAALEKIQVKRRRLRVPCLRYRSRTAGKQDAIKMRIKISSYSTLFVPTKAIKLAARFSSCFPSLFFSFLSYTGNASSAPETDEKIRQARKSDNRKAENQLNASTVCICVTSGVYTNKK